MKVLLALESYAGDCRRHFYHRDAERLLRAGKIKEALVEAEGCLREDQYPEQIKLCLIVKAECLQQLDTYDSLQKAVAVYTQLYERYPEELIFLYRCAMLHEMLDEWVLAHDAYEELIQKNPQVKDEEDILYYMRDDHIKKRAMQVELYQGGLERVSKYLVR